MVEGQAQTKQRTDTGAVVPDPADPTDTNVSVVITAPMSEVALLDILGVFEGGTMRAANTMRVE